jgi:hypothetical protein
VKDEITAAAARKDTKDTTATAIKPEEIIDGEATLRQLQQQQQAVDTQAQEALQVAVAMDVQAAEEAALVAVDANELKRTLLSAHLRPITVLLLAGIDGWTVDSRYVQLWCSFCGDFFVSMCASVYVFTRFDIAFGATFCDCDCVRVCVCVCVYFQDPIPGRTACLHHHHYRRLHRRTAGFAAWTGFRRAR